LARSPTDAREVTADHESALRAFLADAFPLLAEAPIAHRRLCVYCDTLDGHFWIARHPSRPRLVVATGGSGHGFKFAPVLGALIADIALGESHPLAPKFRWRPEITARPNEAAVSRPVEALSLRRPARDRGEARRARHPRRSREDHAACGCARGERVATFVVESTAARIANRRSEHVACAGGREVLAAARCSSTTPGHHAVSNLSSGFCPEPASWPAVATALDRAGIRHPGRFTDAFEFRRCDGCGERNLVKDDDYSCAICGAALSKTWNFTS
jgi:hypothetical protein